MGWLTEGFDSIPDRHSTDWNAIVDRLQASSDPRVRDLLFLGFKRVRNIWAPVFIPSAALDCHLHILGSSGSGKTSLGILPLLIQLIRAAGTKKQPGPDVETSSVVVIDLKGDPSLMQSVRSEAASAGLPFKLVTNQLGLATHGFNPLGQPFLRARSVSQIASYFVQCFGLEYGAGYGQGWFTLLSQHALEEALKHFGRHARSIAELYPYLAGIKKDSIWNAAVANGLKPPTQSKIEETQALVKTVARFTNLEFLNIVPEGDNEDVINSQVDLMGVVTKPQVVYFYLDSDLGMADKIAQLAFCGISTAAAHRVKHNLGASEPQRYPRHRCTIVADEFQRMLGNNVASVFELSRGRSIRLVCAHQSLGQLKHGGVDLTAAVTQNTAMTWNFSASTPQDIESISNTSGERLELPEWNYDYVEQVLDMLNSPNGAQPNWRGTDPVRLVPRISTQDILGISADPTLSILRLATNHDPWVEKGLPIVLKSEHPITLAESRRRADMRWPSVDAYKGMIIQSSSMEQLDEKMPAAKPDSTQSETSPLGSSVSAEPPPKTSKQIEKLLEEHRQVNQIRKSKKEDK